MKKTFFVPNGACVRWCGSPFWALLLTLSLVGGCLPGTVYAKPPGTRMMLAVGSNTLGEDAVPGLAVGYLKTVKQARDVKMERNGDFIFVSGTLPDGSPTYIEIHATGSGDCFASFLGTYAGARGPCDIGMSSRRIKADEVHAVHEKTDITLSRRGDAPGQGSEHPVALDGLTMIVHPNNPISRISFSAIKAIYSRKVTDWKDVIDWRTAGGEAAGMPISPVRRKEPSGTLDFFVRRIEPDPAAMRDANAISAFVSGHDVVARVASTPGAIGFVGQGASQSAGVKRLQVYDDVYSDPPMPPEQSVYPDTSAVQNGSYPLSRVVYLYTSSVQLNPEVEPFVKFALGSEGQSILASEGGLVRIEGTWHEITSGLALDSAPEKPVAAAKGNRQTKVILRLHGSNTVGAKCAVYLAYNFLVDRRSPARAQAPIEDLTTEMETPEGENALAHDVMCDVDGDGVWETIEIRPTGSSDAFRSLHRGACDIGMSSRPIKEAEQRDLEENCGNLTRPGAQFALGLDALTVISSRTNPVENLRLDQVTDIFLGQIKNWSAVGGEAKSMHLHSRPDRSGTYRSFCDGVLNGRSVTTSAQRHAENSQVAAAVAAEPFGIGFVPLASVGPARAMKIGQGPKGDFFPPTDENARGCRYPAALCRYVYLYVPENMPKAFTVETVKNWGTAREFAAMSQTWRGQAMVAACGFIPELAIMDEGGQLKQREGESPLAFVQRLAELERRVGAGKLELKPALHQGEICPRVLFDVARLTPTSESRNTLDRKLASWMKLYPKYPRLSFEAEGWTDPMPTEPENLEISTRRANAVATQLKETLGLQVTAVGKGKSNFPISDCEENKQVNRRVILKVTGVSRN